MEHAPNSNSDEDLLDEGETYSTPGSLCYKFPCRPHFFGSNVALSASCVPF